MSFRLSQRAFTLLELLVAAAITLLLAGILLSVTSTVLELWRRGQNFQTQSFAAKQLFDTLERDLQSLVWRRSETRSFAVRVFNSYGELQNYGWLTDAPLSKPATRESLSLLGNSPLGNEDIANVRFGLSGAWLTFVASTAETNTEVSIPRVISYKIARRPISGDVNPVNPASRRYGLYRSAINDADSFAYNHDVMATEYGSSSNTPALSNRTRTNVTNPNSGNLIAANVIDFGCWLYRRDAAGAILRIFPASDADFEHVAFGASLADNSMMPVVIDVMIRILTDEGASLLDRLESGRLGTRPSQHSDDAEWWWAIATAHSSVFVRRIEIIGGTL